jgi:hypothetical protein
MACVFHDGTLQIISLSRRTIRTGIGNGEAKSLSNSTARQKTRFFTVKLWSYIEQPYNQWFKKTVHTESQ